MPRGKPFIFVYASCVHCYNLIVSDITKIDKSGIKRKFKTVLTPA